MTTVATRDEGTPPAINDVGSADEGALRTVRIDDRYLLDRGLAYISGTQALVRLLLNQKARDQAAGLNTGGFVSGYRGSPLAGLDQVLWGVKDLLVKNQIEFIPGVNEDLRISNSNTLFPSERNNGIAKTLPCCITATGHHPQTSA